MTTPAFELHLGDGPIIATASHNGHDLREEIAALMALDEATRLREEDPFTGEWTVIAPNRLVALRSRFEVDLNRSRETAVYRGPDDAWGLEIWHHPLSEDLVDRSLDVHDDYYRALRELCERAERRHGRFVVLDLHTYNHRRAGPDGPCADAAGNPQVNIGTGSLDRRRWAHVVDRFIGDLGAYDFPGGRLDVRENVKFLGRELARFVHTEFAASGCALAVEFKKFFMDEWTGERDMEQSRAIGAALGSTVPGLLGELARS